MRFWGVRSSVSSLHILTDFRSLTVSLSSTCKICFGAVDGSGFHDVAWKPIPGAHKSVAKEILSHF